ncbi:hypothetical protein ACFO5Q_06760 [Kordiimonas lipolytica]|uniref:Uncharacterized protein n=1 Tax=Kordiimonas lipolytica TaxID=1662421 RepID=A0ABV8U8I8_9PROT|nr:hypothetical protein [Kordiimonas lipolytica]
MPITPNVVTPSISGPDEIWFDPRAGLNAPSRQTGTQEGNDNPQELTIKLKQSLSPVPGDQDYKAGGTLTRSNDKIDLYLNKDLSEASKLDFCENQARISNAELKTGLKVYAKGLDTGFVDLALTLDMLETATRKKTDFSTGDPQTLINVDNNDPAAKKTLQLLAAEVVTPVILQGSPDPQVTASGTPLSLNFKFASTLGLSTYDGKGKVTVTPTDAKCKFYKDAKCEPSDEVPLSNGHTISNSDLKNGALTLYARATSDTATGELAVQLALDSNSAPLKVATAAPASATLSLLPTNKVTPTITTKIDASHDDTIWYPTLAKGALPYVTFGLTQTNGDIAFKGEGVLTRSNDKIALFYDKAMTKPLAFTDNKAALMTAAITGETPFYIKGSASGETELTFELVNDCQPAILVQKPVSTKLTIKEITEVVSHVDWQSTAIRILPESQAGDGTPVRAYITQKTSGGGNFTGTATLTRSDKLLGVYKSDKRPLFSGNNLSVTLSNEAITNTKNEYTVQWLGDTVPEDTVSLKLTPAEASDPYIVTNPSSQLATINEVGEPPLVVEKTNTVTPVIETDYDLVLQSRGFDDGDKKNATSPTLAHFYCTQSDTQIGYQGDGTLARDNAGIRIFRDKDCTDEIQFVGNKATIPNADLLKKDKTYYLSGAKTGKTSLTLSLAKPPSDLGTKPPFVVKDPVTKQLGVIALTLQVFRDDGTQSPIKAVAMTDRAKWQTGRFLPLQDSTLFGRAKLVVSKVATDTWPGDAGEHVISLDVSSDKASVWDAATNGRIVSKKGQPLTLKKSDLGSDKTYWLQSDGSDPSTQARDIHLSLGMDRKDKDDAAFQGAPDSIKPARNGDWAAATVVKIASLTPNIDNWRQYTNQPIDFSQTANTNQDEAKTGQNMLVTATTEPAVKGIGIDFMLWADPGNASDIPAATKSMKLDTHLPASTNSSGKASTRLKIGRYGGLKFTGVSFLTDDAATGAATFGADATKAPVSYKTKPVTAWRKINYSVAAMKRHDVLSYQDNYSDLFNRGKLQNTFAESFLELATSPDVTEVDNVPALYTSKSPRTPQYSDWIDARILDGSLPDYTDRAFNLMFIEHVAWATTQREQWFSKPVVNGNKFVASLGKRRFDTSTSSRFMVPGSATLQKYSLGFIHRWTENIPDNKVKLTDNADGSYNLEIDLQNVNKHGENIKDLWVKITLIDLQIICGLSVNKEPAVMTACRYAEQLGPSAGDEVYSTAAHEVGHFLGLTPLYLPTAAQTGNKYWYQGTSDKTYYLDTDLTTLKNIAVGIGQGPHCMCGFTNFADLVDNHNVRAKVDCLMFDMTVKPPITKVCNTCKKSVFGREYALANTSALNKY